MKRLNLRFQLGALSIFSLSLIALPVYANVTNDQVLSQHIREATAGSTDQNTNSGNGIKTGHIVNAAVTSAKIADGAVTSAKLAMEVYTKAEVDELLSGLQTQNGSSTCPGWSDLHRAGLRQSAASQHTLRLSRPPGALLVFTTRPNIDFGFRQRDNPLRISQSRQREVSRPAR